MRSSNVNVKKSDVAHYWIKFYIFSPFRPWEVYLVFLTHLLYTAIVPDWNSLFSFCFPSYKSMREANIQKMRNSTLTEEKKLLVIHLFMLENTLSHRFQVTWGRKIKALLLQLFISRLQLSVEENMFMMSLNSIFTCLTFRKAAFCRYFSNTADSTISPFNFPCNRWGLCSRKKIIYLYAS